MTMGFGLHGGHYKLPLNHFLLLELQKVCAGLDDYPILRGRAQSSLLGMHDIIGTLSVSVDIRCKIKYQTSAITPISTDIITDKITFLD